MSRYSIVQLVTGELASSALRVPSLVLEKRHWRWGGATAGNELCCLRPLPHVLVACSGCLDSPGATGATGLCASGFQDRHRLLFFKNGREHTEDGQQRRRGRATLDG